MNNRLNERDERAFRDPEFYNEYFSLLMSRSTYASMDLEKDLGDLYDSKNAVKIKNSFSAFKILVRCFDTDLSEELIILVANIINKDSMYISDGYRKVGKYFADTTSPISLASDIRKRMKKLLKDYYGKWSTLDPFEREAKFNIEFLKIHPFEDGNGRTSRLLLNYNLMKQGYAPVIITNDIMEDYFKAITNSDYKWVKDMFYSQSVKEYEVIEKLVDEYFEEKDFRGNLCK